MFTAGPTLLCPTVAPGGAVDPFYAFVTSLIQGADGPVDVKGNNVVLNGGATWGAELVTTEDTFEGASISGTGGKFTFGNGDFCIELFAKNNSPGISSALFDSTANFSAFDGVLIHYVVGLGLGGGTGGLGADFYPTYTPDGTYHHYALIRSGGTAALYRDGIFVKSFSYVGNIPNNTAQITIGNRDGQIETYAANAQYKGWRVTNGVPRYDIGTNFVVPSLPYPTT